MFVYEKVLFTTQLSYHEMWQLLKKSSVVSNVQIVLKENSVQILSLDIFYLLQNLDNKSFHLLKVCMIFLPSHLQFFLYVYVLEVLFQIQ